MKIILSILTVVICFSCVQEENNKVNYQNIAFEKSDTILTVSEQDSKMPDTKVEAIDAEGSILIHFSDFEFTISSPSIYDSREISSTKQDSSFHFLDLGEYLDSATIEIHHDGTHNIDIYQMYENSLTINNEGPHCDLVNWEHYYSDWVTIKKYNNYDFVAETYTPEDYGRFIDADITEFKDVVSEQCSEEMSKLVTDIKSFNEYPCSVGMSRLYFKIVRTNPNTQKQFDYIVVFEVPMGC